VIMAVLFGLCFKPRVLHQRQRQFRFKSRSAGARWATIELAESCDRPDQPAHSGWGLGCQSGLCAGWMRGAMLQLVAITAGRRWWCDGRSNGSTPLRRPHGAQGLVRGMAESGGCRASFVDVWPHYDDKPLEHHEVLIALGASGWVDASDAFGAVLL